MKSSDISNTYSYTSGFNIQSPPTKQNNLIRTQIISGQYQSIWQIIRRAGSTIESPVNSIINHTSDKSHIIAFIFPTLIGLPVITTATVT